MFRIANNKKMKRAFNRVFAFVLFICLFAAFFSSSLNTVSYTDFCREHNHNTNQSRVDSNCLVCDCMEKTRLSLRPIGTIAKGTPFSLNDLFFAGAYLCFMSPPWGLHTPISLKARMNN